MSPDKIKAILPWLGSKAYGSRTGWVLAYCPFPWRHDGKRSDAFAVSHDPKKKSRCKCLNCGYSGDLTDLLLDLNFELGKNPDYANRYSLQLAAPVIATEFEEMDLKPEDIPEFEANPDKAEYLFPENWLQSFKKVMQFPHATHYCLKRGLSLDVLKELDVRYDPLQERVCFPFRNFKGELMGVQGRYIGNLPMKDGKNDDGVLRYYQYGYHGHRNLHVWMGEHLLNLDFTVVPLEGPFDYAKVFMVYPNVAASFTTGLNRTKIKRLADADSLVTYYDHGNGGDKAREAIEKTLSKHPIVHLIPTEEEGDPANTPVEVIREALKDHVEFPL